MSLICLNPSFENKMMSTMDNYMMTNDLKSIGLDSIVNEELQTMMNGESYYIACKFLMTMDVNILFDYKTNKPVKINQEFFDKENFIVDEYCIIPNPFNAKGIEKARSLMERNEIKDLKMTIEQAHQLHNEKLLENTQHFACNAVSGQKLLCECVYCEEKQCVWIYGKELCECNGKSPYHWDVSDVDWTSDIKLWHPDPVGDAIYDGFDEL